MKRREAIKISAGSFAFWTLSGVTVSSMLSSCKTENKGISTGDWKPSALDSKQMEIVTELCDMIIPKTDTPGAIDAGIHRFVDQAIASFFKQSDKDKMIKGLSTLDEVAKEKGAKGFASAEQDLKVAIMDGLINDADTHELTNPDEPHFFYAFRDFVKNAFFTSEVGATQVLAYDPVPGKFIGCMPISETPGKIWS